MDIVDRLKHANNESNGNGHAHANEDLFKVYAQRLFKRSDFDIWESRQENPENMEALAAKKPDFQFWHKRSAHSFWVGCQFILDYVGERIDWCRPDQLSSYRQFEEKVLPEKVYLVIGIGGKPLKPSFMFCLPLEELDNCELTPSILEKYERNPNQRFDYQRGLLV